MSKNKLKKKDREFIPEDRTRHKILIVDDDFDILELLKYNFEKEGYEVLVEDEGSRSVETAGRYHPDLIILDIMMPGLNGLEVCERLRKLRDFENTYIFFLTAKSQKFLQSQAFEMGGDDYIEKITGLRALTHKVRSVLRKDLVIRKCIREIELKSLRLDRDKRKVYYKGREVELSANEFELLYFFAQNPKKIIKRDSLLHNIWGSDIYLIAKSVDTYVNNICAKTGAAVINKERGDAYRLNMFVL